MEVRVADLEQIAVYLSKGMATKVIGQSWTRVAELVVIFGEAWRHVK